MSTTRCCRLIDMPERTWRRWQTRARVDEPARGPWPPPVSAAAAAQAAVVSHAEAHPAWGASEGLGDDALGRSPATTLRIMRRRGLILAADYQRKRCQLAAARRAVFVDPPTGPNQVWQLNIWRVRDGRRRDLADRGLHRLLVEVRAGLAPVADRQSARRDRRRRRRDHRSQGPRRPATAGRVDRPGDQRGPTGHDRHRQRRTVPLRPPRRHHRPPGPSSAASGPGPGPPDRTGSGNVASSH